MGFMNLSLDIDTDTTIDDLRAFVKSVKSVPGDSLVANYDFNNELCGVIAVIDTDDLKSSKE